MRKAALVLAEVERELMRAAAAAAVETAAKRAELERYAAGLGALLAAEPEAPQPVRVLAAELEAAPGTGPELLRAVDSLRHALIVATGQAPADWDLIDPGTGRPDPSLRCVRPGIRAYLEDLRSPFNVGAVFRTADAFGVEELILAPATADPRHPRAERSAMGAIGLVPWRRAGLECLVAGTELAAAGTGLGPAFALELGGTPIGEFEFPERGIVVLGSEELGVSPAALARCGLGAVSIPMAGAKGSLNAAVAFGILMYAWGAALRRRSGACP
jgi:TrmH family RNA methyltransferase